MSVFSTSLNRQSSLEFAPLQFLVMIGDYLALPKFGVLEDPSTGDLSASAIAGYVSVGNISKSGGYSLDNATTSNKVKTHGMAGPSRIIQTERDLTLTVEAQESKKLNFELFFGVTTFGTPTAKGGVSFDIPDLSAGKNYRALFIAQDMFQGLPYYIAYKSNKVQVDKPKAIKGTDGDIQAYSYDLSPLTDDGASSPMTVEIFGPGWNALNGIANTGFYPAVTTLTLSPSTAAMTVAAGMGHTQQVTVVDSNTFDRTSACTFTSSAPAKATVSSTGLVTAVAAGTTNITATYLGITSNACAVTVS